MYKKHIQLCNLKKRINMKKVLFLFAIFPTLLSAAELNTGDTAWMLISTALVLLMTPVGLAMFYAGMTRRKNAVNTFLMVFSSFMTAMVVWIAAGYSIAFGAVDGPLNGFIGGFDYLMLNGINWNSLASEELGQLYPKLVFVIFQGTFAAITVAIIAGSVIERFKFSSWLVFSSLWTLIVYAPVAHMVWGGGFLFNEGALDFAGGTVVHMNAGMAGLVLAILIGKREGFGKKTFYPSNIMISALGAGILWFGWYGFNGGSAFGANSIAGLAIATTTVAAAASAISWMIVEYIEEKEITLYGASSGVISGLVAITPAAGFVSISSAMLIGFLSSIVAYFSIKFVKEKLKVDDSLDAFGVHYMAGLFGAIATGIFAINDKALLWAGPLKDGNDRIGQIIIQLESVLLVSLYSAIGTIVVYWIVKKITGGIRIKES